jgi:endonuclease/exonuclease/phosphatase family metal-dependent hydrolase
MVYRVASTPAMECPNVSSMDEVISGGFTIEQGGPWSRGYVRVVSWNIERGLQFSAILEFLRGAEADLILLQEVDLNARRTLHRDVASELARSLGLNYVFGIEFQELDAGSEVAPAHHGLATLSPWPLSNGRIIRFHRQSNFWKPHWYVPQAEIFQRRLGGRIALVSEALICRQRFVTYNLHLESRGKDILRVQQLQEAVEDARQHMNCSLVVLGGDFNLNAGNSDPAATLRRAGFRDAVQRPELPTTAARLPFQRGRSIDWIYVSDGIRSEGRVHNSIRASDHHPVSATFAIS